MKRFRRWIARKLREPAGWLFLALLAAALTLCFAYDFRPGLSKQGEEGDQQPRASPQAQASAQQAEEAGELDVSADFESRQPTEPQSSRLAAFVVLAVILLLAIIIGGMFRGKRHRRA